MSSTNADQNPLAGTSSPSATDTLLSYFPGRQLPKHVTPTKILGVNYLHVETKDGGDLYVTKFGVPYLDHLKLDNWREESWFTEKRERLRGTSTVYKVPTKEINGRSIDLVVKWSRVGEEVPLDTMTLYKFAKAEFNSPYEEFSLVMEMREQPSPILIRTHHPLAIYVPAERYQLWQTGRQKHRMASKRAKFSDVELDIYRQYILIYEWIKGSSAVEVFEEIMPDSGQRKKILAQLTEKVNQDLEKTGFHVLDHKPEHIIIRRRPDNLILTNKSGDPVYALVDFELLARTPDHEQRAQAARRANYLVHQRDRFTEPKADEIPEHLQLTSVYGVDYVCGHAESTNGKLWVVGKDPQLFDYFLPERWRHTPRQQLSQTHQTYYTLTKDSINLVWKISRVGEQPKPEPDHPLRQAMLEYGFNSPFEEFAIALDLSRKGIPTIYPRAIYMTGLESEQANLYVFDESRYESHKDLPLLEGRPILRKDHNYINIWGYWNGLDEMLAKKDQMYCKGISLKQAQRVGFITYEDVQKLIRRMKGQLKEVGYEDLSHAVTHYILSIKPNNRLLRDDDGELKVRICNFEMVRKL